MTVPEEAASWIKGGWFGTYYTYPSEMAQNFWTAIFAWTTCFVVTIVISLATKPRPENELVGLVYSLTEKPKDDGGAWYVQPVTLGVIVLVLTAGLNFLFW
jgi:SSS family solute:Na+ symporter